MKEDIRDIEHPPLASAIISADGVYRYRLERDLGGVVRQVVREGVPAREYWLPRLADINPCSFFPNEPVRIDGPRLGVLMVNPSKADATNNDPTIVRVMGFARSWGVRRIIVGNLFAKRATDIAELKTWDAERNRGPGNDVHLQQIIDDCDVLMVAWGTLAKLPPHLRKEWRRVVKLAGPMPLYCLGTCADGHPVHPLFVKADTPLQLWSPPT